jgi:glycine cleavage system H lipoate-binding protein
MREFYRTTVVQVGLSCDYIMRALLAVSSIHLAHNREHKRDHYEAVAISHHQAASQVAIPLIGNVTPQNAQMLFVFSALTIYYGE